ncbi:M14 family metallopeptidase [Kamptonema formosum]|uniref:M14 family metallopeptidase n=1 Tax=Kamptonema formosum TaxID=331992 RepID=UPI00034AF0DF|nr:M14 family metallopeptidase [Oscillatoria sp. PCC 10802]
MDFNRYFTNEELESVLQEWAKNYPEYVTLSQTGTSYQGNPIWLLTLTNRATGADTEKPAVWLDANIHATELAGTTTVLHIADKLLTEYGRDDRITRLLDNCTFYAVPRINPDGAALAMSSAPQFIRSGVRAYPYEEKAEGLHRQDIDGDSRVLQMRVPDPNGDWKISSLDPRLMEKRAPDEHGRTYYRIFPEGLIEDFDGYLIKTARPHAGLDFNRNFPFEWRPEAEQGGAGPYPASEPEIEALVDFIVAHPNINFALTYHTYSGVILRPPSTRPDEDIETDDLQVYKKIGERGSQLTGYPCLSVYHDFRYHPKEIVTGIFDDWMYDHFGAFAFTIELWNPLERAGVKNSKVLDWGREHPHEEDLKVLQWFDEHVGEGAYVPWYNYNHPQLGPVELGGWDPLYTWRNPPPAFMGGEAARNAPFALALADMLPHLSIHTLEVTSLGNDNYRLNLVVENTGFLPTHTSQQAKKRKSARPVLVELELPEGVTLLTGKRRTELGDLEGRSNKLTLVQFGLGHSSSTDNRARAEWVLKVTAQANINIIVRSDRAGVLRREVQLG